MKEILAAGTETGGAIRHDTLTLCSANLAAEVGLAGLAELTLATFGSAIWCDQRMDPGEHRGIETY